MAVNARRVSERVIARIRASDYTMRIVFPYARTKPTGATAVPLPVSPLLAKPNPQPVPEEEPERILPDLEVPCLYLETSALSDLRSTRAGADIAAWDRDIKAYVRVISADVDKPEGGTVLDGCDYVEIAGTRFKVMSVVRPAASMINSGTYYVALTGAVKS